MSGIWIGILSFIAGAVTCALAIIFLGAMAVHDPKNQDANAFGE